MAKFSSPDRKENIISLWLHTGLSAWQNSGSRVSYLTDKQNSVLVPRIDAPAIGYYPNRITVIEITGHHLEETSGPRLGLTPEAYTANRKKGVSFIIYPVINQCGLAHHEKSAHDLLRENPRGINYNDGWGIDGIDRKTTEGGLIEQDILEALHLRRNEPVICVSRHEDDDRPGQGLLYTNEVNRKMRRDLIRNASLMWGENNLAKLPDADEEIGGHTEAGYIFVNVQDEKGGGSVENWMADSQGIPTVLVESPYGIALPNRVNFQRAFGDAAIRAFQNTRTRHWTLGEVTSE